MHIPYISKCRYDGTICDLLQFVTTAQFVTTECCNLWLRHDLWPQNSSICDPARIVTKSALICDRLYIMILECKLWGTKHLFVFTLIMFTELYNMMHIYIWIVIWYLCKWWNEKFVVDFHWYYLNIMHDIYTSYIIYIYHILCVIRNINVCIFLNQFDTILHVLNFKDEWVCVSGNHTALFVER